MKIIKFIGESKKQNMLEKFSKKIGWEGNEVHFRKSYTGQRPVVDGVSVQFKSSTSTADRFNLAMKMEVIDWSDPVHAEIEKLVDERLYSITHGRVYVANWEKEWKSGFHQHIVALNKTDAKKWLMMGYAKEGYKLTSLVKKKD